MPKRYPTELRDRAVRLVLYHRRGYGSQAEKIQVTADRLGVGHELLFQWVAQAKVDAGTQPGVTTAEQQRIKALERGQGTVAHERNPEIGCVFLRPGARPKDAAACELQSRRKEEYGVERICAVGARCSDRPAHLLHSTAARCVGTHGHRCRIPFFGLFGASL
jgi:transposase